MINIVILKQVTSDELQLLEVIKFAIGNPEPKKIAKVINSYRELNNKLIGAYLDDNLIGIIGYLQTTEQITIRHISVLPKYRQLGIGRLLLSNLKKQSPKYQIIAETDEEAVTFYQKCHFTCNPFQGKYNNLRYKCEFNKNY